MPLQIIGPGFGRTGTKSLKLALEQLGFGPCHHMHEVRDNPLQLPAWEALSEGETADWEAMFTGYRAQVDWPGARYWRELAAFYPEAKVILTKRDPDLWYDSMCKTIIPFVVAAGTHPAEHPNRIAAWGEKALNQQLFSGKLQDRAHAISVYHRHNAEVEREIPKNRLLVFDVGDGWGPLCSFLEVAAPASGFPHENTTRAFYKKEWQEAGAPTAHP